MPAPAATPLSLESPEWRSLQHAYGPASDIPPLLRKLETFPTSEGNAEPWFSLYSALAHQGDVYPASFAAVPHVVRILASDPKRAGFDFFNFPAWVETCRQRGNINVPSDLADSYFASIAQLAPLVSEVIDQPWSRPFLMSALSALAVSKGFVDVAASLDKLD